MGWQGAGRGATTAPELGVETDAQATFTVTAMRDLKVEATVRNRSDAHLLVFDRLWRLDAASHAVADAEPAYRFVRDGKLRILLGLCPLPRLRMATYRNVPHAGRLARGESLSLTLALPGPIREYSVYFPELPTSETRRVHVERVELVIQYVTEPPESTLQPSATFPGAFHLSGTALNALRMVVVASPRVELDVLSRADTLDRLTLPGEQPEPLKLR
jgi:hypothetical protein